MHVRTDVHATQGVRVLSLKLASWNVNSINARLPTITAWLKDAAPDVVCLQELKCVDAAFPTDAMADLGYTVLTHGQKSYNGVAILTKFPAEDVTRGLDGDPDDEQARYIEAVITTPAGLFRVASLYAPNGNPTDTAKFDYKLAWLARLRTQAEALLDTEDPVILAGDYNVIPRDVDVHDPAAWADDALLQPQSRAAFRAVEHLGYTDAYEAVDGRAHQYTFWDYQAGAWPKDHGVRIDHLLLSPQAADRLTGVEIARDTRGMEKPSDHAPIVGVFG